MKDRIKVKALESKQYNLLASTKSMYHETPFTRKTIPDFYKSTPFKPHKGQTDFEQEDFSKLNFEAYCEFFGFSKTSLYSRLPNAKLGEALVRNVQVEIIDQDTFVPYHLLRPAVDIL
jgi:hypothetical protein